MYEIEISTALKFVSDIKQKILEFFKNPKSEYFVYAGWDFHIHKLKTMFSKDNNFCQRIGEYELVGVAFDSQHFTKYRYPFSLSNDKSLDNPE